MKKNTELKLYLVTYAEGMEAWHVVAKSMADIEKEADEPIHQITLIDDEITIIK